MIQIAIHGVAGRMGYRILELANNSSDFSQPIGQFDKTILTGQLSTEALQKKGKGVLIDFSSPDGAIHALECAGGAGWGVVVGTTGLDDKFQKALEEASHRVPVVVSSNMSLGINLLIQALELLAKKLPADFDIEITEAHHRHKKDSPSGTALMLARAIAEAKKWDMKKALKYRAEGRSGERPSEEIGMHVIRAGEIVGDHAVLFSGPAETIEIKHRAHSRDVFARGALRAAIFAAYAKPGKYSMKDVLG